MTTDISPNGTEKPTRKSLAGLIGFGHLLTLGGFLIIGSIQFQGVRGEVKELKDISDQHGQQIDGIQKSTAADHDVLIGMQSDLKYIRQTVDRQQGRTNQP